VGRVSSDEGDLTRRDPRHWRPVLKELLWLREPDREKACSRCEKKKRYILNLSLRGERFGICRPCLETLWGELRGDD
jgi:hypothetical protein